MAEVYKNYILGFTSDNNSFITFDDQIKKPNFSYNKVVFKMQAPFYKLVMELTKYTITFELDKIEAKKLTEDLIQFPKGKPVKEL